MAKPSKKKEFFGKSIDSVFNTKNQFNADKF